MTASMVLWTLGLTLALALLIALVVTVIWMVRTAKRHDRKDQDGKGGAA